MKKLTGIFLLVSTFVFAQESQSVASVQFDGSGLSDLETRTLYNYFKGELEKASDDPVQSQESVDQAVSTLALETDNCFKKDCLFAAQDATIIHGVAFDDSMGADIKVTIVATGLGGSASKKMPKNTFEFESVEPILPKPDISHSSREVKKVSSSDLMDSEYLDIPSFVKKQID